MAAPFCFGAVATGLNSGPVANWPLPALVALTGQARAPVAGAGHVMSAWVPGRFVSNGHAPSRTWCRAACSGGSMLLYAGLCCGWEMAGPAHSGTTCSDTKACTGPGRRAGPGAGRAGRRPGPWASGLGGELDLGQAGWAGTWTWGQRAGRRPVSGAAEIKRAPDGKSGALFVGAARAEIFNTCLPGRDSKAHNSAALC